MGCNTSSESKPGKDVKAEQNHKEAESDKKSPPKEEQAATKIQAVFRGHQTRKTMSMKASGQGSQGGAQKKVPEPEPTRAELEAEFRADDKELCSAATKIQASFRGHQSRKQVEQQEKEAMDKDKAYPFNKAFKSRLVWPERKVQKSNNGLYHQSRKEGQENSHLEPKEQPFAEEQNRDKGEKLSKLDTLETDMNCASCILKGILDPDLEKGLAPQKIKDQDNTEVADKSNGSPDETVAHEIGEEKDSGHNRLSEPIQINLDTDDSEVLITEQPQLGDFSEQPTKDMPAYDMHEEEQEVPSNSELHGPSKAEAQILEGIAADYPEVSDYNTQEKGVNSSPDERLGLESKAKHISPDENAQPESIDPLHTHVDVPDINAPGISAQSEPKNVHEQGIQSNNAQSESFLTKDSQSESNKFIDPDNDSRTDLKDVYSSSKDGQSITDEVLVPATGAQSELTNIHESGIPIPSNNAHSDSKDFYFPSKDSQSKEFYDSGKDRQYDLTDFYVLEKDGTFKIPVVPDIRAKSKSTNFNFPIKDTQSKVNGLGVSGISLQSDPGHNIENEYIQVESGPTHHELVELIHPKKILKFKIHDAVTPLEIHMPFHYNYVQMLIPSISPKKINVIPQCVNIARKGSARRLRACHRNVWRKISKKNRVILNLPSHHCVETGKDTIPNDLMVLKTNTKPVSVKTKERSWLSIFGSDAESQNINTDNKEEMLKTLENWTVTRGNKNFKRNVKVDEQIFGVSE